MKLNHWFKSSTNYRDAAHRIAEVFQKYDGTFIDVDYSKLSEKKAKAILENMQNKINLYKSKKLK